MALVQGCTSHNCDSGHHIRARSPLALRVLVPSCPVVPRALDPLDCLSHLEDLSVRRKDHPSHNRHEEDNLLGHVEQIQAEEALFAGPYPHRNTDCEDADLSDRLDKTTKERGSQIHPGMRCRDCHRVAYGSETDQGPKQRSQCRLAGFAS